MIAARLRQFAHAGARPSQADFELARTHLDGALFALFRGQHPRDVVHSAGTARWLLAAGCCDPDAIAAGLLHDVGKGHQRRIDRTVYVAAGWARLATALAHGGSRFEVRRAIERSLRHSEVGAAMLRGAGASARVVELTLLHHERRAGDPVLALLQQADAAS
jgi:putative nucleotidyltransferase with HDIG domain